ncbi:dna polymerase pol4 [Diplodia corticola]|uniref:DNA polymerase lambda n=1 Tax=Diplodia corticola TaxID=236234 RepID=A0A1J9SDL4_9PEZI|nr:dna polymerase pol4 [Diplodia corticola]OJD37932.1 dna polymerase pol4 [Diplodia corticola]
MEKEKARPLFRKEHFYDTLSALDEDEDDQPPDEGRLASQKLLTDCRSAPVASRLPAQPPRVFRSFAGAPTTRPPLGRTLSAPSPNPASAHVPENLPDTTYSPPRVASSPVRSSKGDTMSSPKQNLTLAQLKRIPRAPGKGKKEAKIKLAPENRRIFKDLVFYFFPSNDINGARRMRIAKAIEYGATWVVDWCDHITHIIVDKDLTFEDVRTHLPHALSQNLIIVNETYPSDCLIWRSILDPKLPQFLLKGQEELHQKTAEDEIHLPASQPSQPADKNVPVAEPATPLRSEKIDNEQPPSSQDFQTHNKAGSAGDSNGVELYNDALEEIIIGAKNTDYLPLELEDEDSQGQASASSDSDTEDERPRKMAKTSLDQHAGSSEQFQCMKKNDGKTSETNPNSRTIEVLTEMGNYYEQTKDEWRSRAYRKAISVLRKQTVKIITKEEAIKLPCVGPRLAAKIEEIVWTNRLRRLDNAHLEPGDEALQTFLKIYGVGLSKASKWVMAGLRTLEDLTRNNVPLTTNQKVGLAHYTDFNTRIPRAEVTAHGAVIQAALTAIDPAATATVGGSYRRGASDSGDIDVLISHPTADLARLQQIVFEELVPVLTADGFLKVALATHGGKNKNNNGTVTDHGTKWHGASALPQSTATTDTEGAQLKTKAEDKALWRRIDLLLVPASQLGAALIYFTGNDIFNRSIRLLASRKGMRLNQRGLYKDVLRGWGREKITEGELVEGRDEKKIFDILGVPWRPPEHRIC